MEPSVKQFRKRNAILECLRHSDAHPSAEELHQLLQKEHADISLASVYRNLALFREQGLVLSLGTVGGIERFDGRVDPHVHFACSRCGCVSDLPDEAAIVDSALEAARKLGCQVEETVVLLKGTCKTCLESDNRQPLESAF